MPDLRVFCPAVPAESADLVLSAAESHHLVVVNRGRRGDPVVAFDGSGREGLCELAEPHKRAAVLRVRSVRSTPPPSCALTLVQALPKGPTMDTIVRKATELGAARIVPLETERTQVHLESERQERKREKWQTAAVEAAKQCGNPFLPDIAPMQTLAAFLASSPPDELKLVASLHPGAGSLKDALASFRQRHARGPHTAAWLIGPEGDLTSAEVAAAQAAGFLPVTLGPQVLRCDTAAVYALSVLSYELRDGASSI